MNNIRLSLNKDKWSSVNLYFQDESGFGLMTHVGKCLTARGVKPKLTYQHKFKTTCLYGAYSPIDGASFVWEINGVSTKIFEAFLNGLAQYRPEEYKIVVIDNADFYSTKNIDVPT